MIGVNYSQAGSDVRASLQRSAEGIERTLERLSTGRRINRASDDPAGLVAAVGFKADLTTTQKKMDGLVRENQLFGARDGGLAALGELTIRLRGIVVTAANRDGLSPEELDGLQAEAIGLLQTIDTLSQTQRFNGFQILRGYSTGSLGLRDGGFDLMNGDIGTIQEQVDAANETIGRDRAAIGAAVLGNESQIRVLQEEEIQLTGALSDIVDVDIAAEVSELVRNQVLQAAASQLAIAELQQRETALLLLEGVSRP